MKQELKKQGWMYPKEPEPTKGEIIEYMHDGVISKGVYQGSGLVDDDNHTDLLQEIDLWKKLNGKNVNTILAAGHPLTRDEAKVALLEGYKIGHRYFEPTEYIYAFNYMTIFSEEGYKIDADIFWNDRSGEQWETGWFIYGE